MHLVMGLRPLNVSSYFLESDMVDHHSRFAAPSDPHSDNWEWDSINSVGTHGCLLFILVMKQYPVVLQAYNCELMITFAPLTLILPGRYFDWPIIHAPMLSLHFWNISNYLYKRVSWERARCAYFKNNFQVKPSPDCAASPATWQFWLGKRPYWRHWRPETGVPFSCIPHLVSTVVAFHSLLSHLKRNSYALSCSPSLPPSLPPSLSLSKLAIYIMLKSHFSLTAISSLNGFHPLSLECICHACQFHYSFLSLFKTVSDLTYAVL